MINAPYSAEDWPIAAAMLPFGNKDSRGGAIHDAEPEEWAKHLRLVRHMGFTEVDPTDTWVRVGDLSAERLADFKSVLSDVGLTDTRYLDLTSQRDGSQTRQGVPRLQSPGARRGGGARRPAGQLWLLSGVHG